MSETKPLNIYNPANSLSHLGCVLYLEHAFSDLGPSSEERLRAIRNNINLLMADIHRRNVEAGWWTDLKTGESIVLTRNFGEMIMLMVTELREAEQGRVTGEPDDKVPDFPMHTVEIADALIRAFDFAGARCPTLPDLIIENLVSGTVPPADSLFQGVIHLADCMEAFRKQRVRGGALHLAWFFIWAFRYARHHNLRLADAFAAKIAYNATREDHKLANRKLPDGKLV